jgi:hypothetical protein
MGSGPYASGAGELAIIRLKAVGEGFTALDLREVDLFGGGGAIPAVAEDGEVQVSEGTQPTATHTPTPTSTPTPTPTPTSTPTPTPTPTPTSTPTPLPVRVLANHTTYTDGEGALHVVGEVENGTADPVYRVGITVQLLSSYGEVVDIGHGVAPLQHLAAGERTCFHVSLAEPADWASYAFEAVSYSPGGPPPALSIVNDSGTYVPSAGWYLLGGEVRNDHGARLEGVTAVDTLSDGAGDAVGCDGAYVLSIDLEPGEQSLFELAFTGRDYGDVASYRVQADGEPE